MKPACGKWTVIGGMALAVALIVLTPGALAISQEALAEYQRGIAFETQQNFKDAEKAYQRAIALDPYDAMSYMRLAYLVERDNRKDEALQLYQKALELNPKDGMIHLPIAELYEAKNQPEKALAEYQQVIAANPDYAYAYLPMARLEKSLNHTQPAIADYQSFLKIYPTHVDAQRELAAMQMSQNQYTQAAETYQHLKVQQIWQFKDDLAYGVALNQADKPQEALAALNKIITPSVVLYEQKAIADEKLNNLPDAYDNYQKAMNLAPKDTSDLYLKLADLSVSMNQPDKAEDSLRSYLKIHPENGKIAKSLGDMLIAKKDYTGATDFYEQALQKLPDAEKAYRLKTLRQMGYAYQMEGKLDLAQTTYEKAQAQEDDRQTRLNLALVYHQQKKYEQALDLYRKLSVEDPASPTLRKDMGQVLLALGDKAYEAKDYTKALNTYQDAYLLGSAPEVPVLLGMANCQYALKNTPMAYSTYQRVLEKDPDNQTARLNKAQLDIDEKNYMAALENLRWVVQKHPDTLDAYKLLAFTHAQLGDYGQAIINYKKALELQPHDATLLMGYGNAWRQVGDLDRAQQAYEMAKTESPKDALVQYNLGSVYNLKNQLDASITAYKKALELDPNFVEPYYGLGTTLEKKQQTSQALSNYQLFIQKAPAGSAYIPLAKARVDFLKKSLTKPTAKTMASAKPPSTKPAVKTPATKKPAPTFIGE